MKSTTKLSIVLFLITAPFILFGQRYVNQEWSSITGLPVNIHWSSSMIASTGHIITVGNTFTSGQSTNVLLTKYATDGTLVWQVEYDNPDNLEDYGIALCEDNSGDFYIAGTSYRSSSSSLELTVLKFNSSGQHQWTHFFDGSAGGDDIPAEIVTDGTYVYVTGGTESTSTASDYVTMKLKNDGTVLWTEYYDHNMLDDVAVEIDINQTGEIVVSGGSADQSNLYDMVTIKYDANGSQINVHRSNYNVGIDQPTCFGIDTGGSTIVGGYYVPTSGEMNISIISLDDTLGLKWSVLHDPTTGEDKVMDMAVTPSGSIYVVGHSEYSPNEFACYVAKFDNNGNLVWERQYKRPDAGAFGKRISLDVQGNLNIVGMVYDGPDTNILTLQYDSDGIQIMAKEYDAGGVEMASSIELDFWGNIYVTGTTSTGGNSYVTLKYAFFDRDYSAVDSVDYSFVDDEIIIQFKPAATITSAFDDKGRTFGTLNDFINQSVIDDMNDLYDGQYEFGRLEVVKVFPNLTSEDTTLISRGGDEVRIHHFWSTLLVILPSSMAELAAANTIYTLRDAVYSAELNLIGTTSGLPDDSVFVAGAQVGMESSLVPDRDIEMDRAWDVFTGTSDARVGIFDTGIKWNHKDFSKTGSQSWADRKVVDGKDYWSGELYNPSIFGDDNGHGTRGAGIVGAIRNNSEGIAGIAGGDEEQSNYGCDLIDLKILNYQNSFNQSQTAVSNVAEAWMDGITGFGNNGFALDIMNNAWAIKPGNNLYTDSNKILFFKMNKTVYDAGVINVVSRGNNAGTNRVIPSTLGPDHWVISVGASDATGKNASFSGKGRNIDILAPGVSDLVTSTYWLDNAPYWTFNGISASIPHVSGVAALLVSNDQMAAHWPTVHLEPDDIENLIQIYVTDIDDPNPPYEPGYDDQSGWGRLHAGLVMEHMEWPHFLIKHFDGQTNSYSSTQVANNVALEVKEDFDGIGVTEGSYIGDIYKIEITVSHNIGNDSLLNYWIRNGSAHSTLFADSINIYDIPYAKLDTATETQAMISGYIFKLETDAQSNPVNKWLPVQNGSNVKYGYSLHVYDSLATGVEEDIIATPGMLRAWPNPTGDVQIVSMPEGKNVKVSMIDMQGRVLKLVYYGNTLEDTRVKVDVKSLSPGAYFYRLVSEEQTLTYKFIKK